MLGGVGMRESGTAGKARRAHASDGELAVIDRIRTMAGRTGPAAGKEIRLGIGDDCAILRPRPSEDIVVTTDFSLEGRHFRRDWHSAESVGHRALARGLSDVAAMGARPIGAFLSLALPRDVARERVWVDGFLRGLLALAQRTGVPLAGGDTAEAPGAAVLADITLLGAVARGRALRRDGARAGDRLFVTGALGGSAMELRALAAGTGKRSRRGRTGSQPQQFPEPRLETGRWLVRHQRASAAIDVSDGLSTDLHHLCRASEVCAEVELARLPLHPLLAGLAGEEAMGLALHGGEDYELLFTAGPGMRLPPSVAGVPVTEIGRITQRGRGRPRVVAIDGAGRRKPLAAAGWEHLR